MTRESKLVVPTTPLWTFALGGLIFSLAAASFQNEGVASGAFVLRYALAGALIALAYVQSPRSVSLRELSPAVRRLIMSAWLLVATAATSTTWSIDPGETALQTLVFALLITSVHVLATRRWYSHEALESDIQTIFAVLAATVGLSVVLGSLVGARLAGLYANPNTLGVLAVFAICLGTALLLERPRAWVGLGTALAIVAAVSSGSRTATLGLVVAIAVMVFRRRRPPSPRLVVGTCFALSVVVGLLLFRVRLPLPAIVERFTTTSASPLSGRELTWSYALRLWEQEPWTGFGFRTGEIIFRDMSYLSGGSTTAAVLNSYLQILLELGYLGMIPLVLLVASLVGAIFRSRFEGLQGGLATLVIAGLAIGVTESALFGLGSAIAWVFWFGSVALACTLPPRIATREQISAEPESASDSNS